MPNFSFVHTADLHLDSPFRTLHLNHPELAHILRDATFEAFERVIQLCLDRRVDFLLVAGDVYDAEDKGLRAQVKFRDGLKRLHEAGIRSFVVFGNHDPLSGWSSTLEWPDGVHLFGDRIETVQVERDGELLAVVQGISYPVKDESRNLAKRFKRRGTSFQIGLLHANVGSDTGHEPYAPCNLDDLVRADMDYWALGHVHKSRVLSQEHPVALYPGNIQGRHIMEKGEKGCYLVRVNGGRPTELEFHPTDVIRWEETSIPIDGLETEQRLMDAMDRKFKELLRKAAGHHVVTRLTLTGRGPLYSFLRRSDTIPDLLELLREKGMSSPPFLWTEQVRLEISPEIDLKERRSKDDFLGEILRCAQDLTREVDSNSMADEALALLYEDARAGRYLSMPDESSLAKLLDEAVKLCLDHLESQEEE